jgi:photosystem II stability/assembly factor-like uncharacterized protein
MAILPRMLKSGKWAPLVLFILSACGPTPATWVPFSQGLPTRTTVVALAADPSDPQRIIAGAYDTTGAYASTDQARTWSPFAEGLNGAPVLALNSIGDTLLAATSAGLYQLHDATWERVGPIPAVAVYSIARGVDGSAYASTNGYGLFMSAGAARSWTPLAGLNGEIVLSVAALDARTLIAGTSGHGAFITRDRGAAWRPLDLFAGEYVALVVVDPRDGKSIYLGTRHGLYRSRDEGANWQRLLGGIETEIVHALLFAPGRIYAATDSHGVYVSDDDSASWQSASTGLPGGVAMLAFDQLDAQTISVGAQNGVYLTHDGGKAWQTSSAGLGAPQLHALALNSRTGSLWVATEEGLYRADPKGEFTPVNIGPLKAPVLSVSLAPDDPQVAYAGTAGHGIFLSRDGGVTWTEAGDIFHGRLSVPGLVISPADANTVFARVLFERLYKASDGGQTWHAVWSGMRDGDQVAAMSAAPGDPSQMYAGTSEGLYFSQNGGESWQGAGLDGLTEFAIWIDPRDSRSLLVGTTDGLYKRTSPKSPWSRSGLEGITVTEVVRTAEGDFFAGTKYQGVWVSRDDARTWARFGVGLSNESVIELAADEGHGILYAATPRGLFKINYP